MNISTVCVVIYILCRGIGALLVGYNVPGATVIWFPPNFCFSFTSFTSFKKSPEILLSSDTSQEPFVPVKN